MRMRKYRMTARRVAPLNRLLRNDRVSVKRIAVAAHEKKEDVVYIFYEMKEESLEKDAHRLEQLRANAKKVSSNAVYQKLTNQKQKILFLCTLCKVSKADAEDIVELAKISNVEEWVREEKERLKEEEGEKQKGEKK